MFRYRTLLDELITHVENKKITILVGPRQVGKTTLMKQLYEIFKNTYKCLFFDLDIPSHYLKVNTYESFINSLKLEGYHDNGPLFVVFLDEFQRFPDMAIVLKNIADHHHNIKIYASGSSSLAIHASIQESLSGRKRIVYVYPLSFKEYLKFLQYDYLVEKIENLFSISSDNLKQLLPELYPELNQFLIYGGYPEVALAKNEKEKGEVLASIFDLYVKKDLMDFLKIDKIRQVKTIIEFLSINNGQQINYNQISQIVGLDEKTVKNYIEILKETFIVFIQRPWFTNKNKELTKLPKIYFIDNGVRNFFINNFTKIELRPDAPFLFEGFIVSECIKKNIPSDALKYWRTKNKQEVDLIIDYGINLKIIEIKYKDIIKKSDLNGLFAFKRYYPQFSDIYCIAKSSNKDCHGIPCFSPFDFDKIIVH